MTSTQHEISVNNRGFNSFFHHLNLILAKIKEIQCKFSPQITSHMLGLRKKNWKKLRCFVDNFNRATERKRLCLPVRLCLQSNAEKWLFFFCLYHKKKTAVCRYKNREKLASLLPMLVRLWIHLIFNFY